MRLAALIVAWAFSSVLAGITALVRSDYLALGMAGSAMGTSAGTAWWVYINVRHANTQPSRLDKVEADADKIEQRLRGK